MIEAAYAIHDHLPLRRPILDDIYINSLWDAFERLTDHDLPKTQGFAIAPFHLLFMTAVQHKVLRLCREMPAEYTRAFTLAAIRSDDKRILLAPTSAFDLARMPERTMFSLFEIIELDSDCIGECKEIIDQRNDGLMHATGTLPSNAESAIENYLTQLDKIQSAFTVLNDGVAAELKAELEPEDRGDMIEFLEKHLFLRSLSRADFKNGELNATFGKCIDENF